MHYRAISNTWFCARIEKLNYNMAIWLVIEESAVRFESYLSSTSKAVFF